MSDVSDVIADLFTAGISDDTALRNVANAVIELTTVIRYYNGRGRSRTYNGDIDAIASAARQLADKDQVLKAVIDLRDNEVVRRQNAEHRIVELDAENARLRTELAAAVDERNFADRRCAELEQQLLQLDADNAALIRSNNNKTLHAIDWSTLPPEAQDYRIGLDAGRWKWRDIPRKVRLDLVRCVIRNTGEQPTQTQFDAIRPPWMATATSQCAAFGAQWSLLANLDREIEVAP